ncbi:non-ribosomal peptide synthase [Trichormus variabilis ARAD]|uniref:Non-ribosomal peptide synthase n=1 Tax=Trichormus variabilis N2B TaxID=2681315 RepID=A0ABR6S5U1_ANAVA|nr:MULTISPECIES: non-ribosomal peptide synthetase [Nostocaceae]MBC1213138.1 non-ribosomal peptide synthase [Trichormus variabilis ARAD]MBC1254469.1 non-ribosomal peptide synthase [Trichormus variabilis V5]MBC1265568.1 non-ribosomal peptide synthase [Trichormus variabilis FSR]MBC1301761.1 non-ribosomal peptide synthase [Trichormus variabilis N2B]MBC1310185.1 non-ribosomal peptide synthase [Trichormus variabilis PNB]
MSELLKRLEQLSPQKRELVLQKLLAQQSSTINNKPKLPRIEAVSSDKLIPLSFPQQRLWFLDQMEGNSAAYNMAAAVEITGNLQVSILENIIAEIIQRHAILRTNFKNVDDNAVQIIAPHLTINIPVIDLQTLPVAEQFAEVECLAIAEQLKPFDLANDCLLRVTLLQLAPESYVLLVTMHHIVSDGWSMGVFIQEFSTLYTAFSQNQPSLLPELAIQYADFAHWQRQCLQGEVLENQLNYWRQQLAGIPPILELPTDRPRPPVQTFQGQTLYFELDQNLTKQLNILCQKSGTTMFMTLMAAFATLLYRYSRQSDIVIGSPIANRDRQETFPLIGLFVNTLVLRTNLEGNPSFAELLQKVKQVALDAYAHQDVPLERLVEALQPERSLSHMPLFQVAFAMQNAPMGKLELPNLSLNLLKIENRTAKFDLALSMQETESGLLGEWEFNTDLFDATTISRMARHFQTLLENIVANPQQRIAEVSLLSASEQHQLLVDWNNTTTDYPQGKCIHQLFEEWVEQTPDAVAVVFENQQITYKELNHRANQLAHQLQTLGVKPDVLVGICVERSLEMIVGLLGILKAGGGYVPLDPNYPSDRLAFMLNDAQLPVLLTQQQLVEKLPEHQAIAICLDADWNEIAKNNSFNPTSTVTTANLAYVIYTSGSTGKPKGVMVEHTGLCNLAKAQIQTFDVQTSSRILQFASFSFDASIFEVVMALGTGARLYLGTKESLLPGSSLIQLLQKYGITHITLPPSALAVLPADELPALQTIIVAGEACPPDLVERWSRGRRFFNAYGPTEATVWSTVAECSSNSTNKPPIGRPITNTQIYLLDQDLQPVPVGVPGELHIGGIGLARGYLNRPELTQQKFIPHPFSNEPEARLYKTGDLARYLSDGNIEYLGRIDHQVKLRGFRIELGEIEALLSQHPGVIQNTLIIREDIPGSQRLVAYTVANPDQIPTISELRQFLKERLPEYMVPSAFVMLDTLPLTPNGKVDRRALPAPESRPELAVNFVAPRTPQEEKLAAIWADVLRLQQVGIHDNFFEIGGDSILSLQIIARANQAGIQLNIKQLFQHQTIAELAAVANTIPSITAEQGLITGSLPLTPIQHWFFDQNLPQPAYFNQSVLLEVPNDLKLEILESALQQLLLHHDALRLRFVQEGESWSQTHADANATVALTCVDLSEKAPQAQQTALETTANQLHASLNLSQQLMQAALFHFGATQSARLLIIVHHLAVDGVSWRILVEDLFHAYQQLNRGETVQLPAKTTSFKEWSQRLTEYSHSEALAGELDFWLGQSSGSIALPVDYPQAVNTVASSAQVSVSLDIEKTRALLQEVPAIYNTQINDVLLTALVQSFAQWTGESSLLVDLEGHGREELFADIDLSRTVGWFTCLFPIKLELAAIANVGKTLKSIKEQLRPCQKRGINYGILRYLNPNPAIRHQLTTAPQAQVSFNYLGQFDQELSESGAWKLAQESAGNEQGISGDRTHLLEVNALVASGKLQLNWTYSQNIHQTSTIEALAAGFINALTEIIHHCQSTDVGGYTPSDFPEAELTQEYLDNLVGEMANRDTASHKKNIESIYPLSPMQQGILFHSLYDPESGVYCEQLSCTLHGSINTTAFAQAWQRVVERHSALRTFFVWDNLDQPHQVVCKTVNLPFAVDDWRSLSPTEQQEKLTAFQEADRNKGFELNQAPLMRCSLIQTADDTYEFVWTFHHLLIDGWSLPVVVQEAFAFYEAANQGHDLYLKTPRPFRDYITWLQQQDLSQAKEFWQRSLQGFTAPTPLMADKSIVHNSQQQQTYHEQHIQLPQALTTQLESLARQNQLTLNTLVQGIWALLLSHYSNQKDVVFGTTVSGRPPALVDVETMVGMFINALPVRVQVSEDEQILPWLKDLHTRQVEREQYSYTPLVEIQRVSEIASGTPMFETNVAFYNYPVDPALQNSSSGLKITNISNYERTKYPLMLVIMPGENISVGLSYEGNRFNHETIADILENFATVANKITEQPDAKLQTVAEILVQADKQKQLIKDQKLAATAINKLHKFKRKSA